MRCKFLTVLLAILILSACKKNNSGEVLQPPVTEKYLTVILNPDYLSLTKIDSAFISWTNGAKVDSVKLTPLRNDLVVAFNKLPSQEKTYQLHLFTNQKMGNNTPLLWQKDFTVNLATKNALNVVAPLNLNDVNWKPRLIMKDGAGLQAYCGIRPNDPYFRFHQIDQDWKEIVVDRSYWNTIGPDTRVGGAVWHASNVLDATGSYANDNYFTLLPAQIGNQFWNHVEVVMLFTNATQTQTRILDFTHTF
jgi:hypothetical protein